MDKKLQRKVLTASLVGSSIEWFDFFLYASVASVIFSKHFFVTGDPAVSTMISYFGIAISFFIRPLGGVIFAHIGDRMGRKKTLVMTLTMMGVATVCIGLLPTYETAGIWAPVLLLLLRLVQGLGIGGEYGGSLLLATEYAPHDRRGFYGSFPQLGVPIGLVLGSLAFFIMTSILNDEQFTLYGWRIPFIMSGFFVAFGLWIRTGLEETPDYKAAVKNGSVPRIPLLYTFKHHWKEVIITCCAKFVETAPFYLFSTFIVGYGTKTLGFSFDTIMLIVLTAASITVFIIPLYGRLSDRIGRRKLYLAGSAGIILFAFPYFLLIDQRSVLLLFLATFIGLSVIWSPLAAVQGTLFSEAFSKEVRYTGVSLGYQVGAALAGGTAPLIAEYLTSHYHSTYPVAIYLVIAASISFIGVLTLNKQSSHV
ncbi:MFS transporter [Macrococcus brunensis]|uniref:MFS transporter n=1 Tax=Macrococcus brunensis TaxID=198483 RepID=UPI001EEF814B|nr:MFS transporter [Macrococcus brunensis]ULG73820.1 MHS family MFS transporter [Macrococcus brunensis]